MKNILIIILATLCFQASACRIETFDLRGVDPATGNEFVLKVRAYKAKEDLEKQTLILPPVGGVTTLENKYASLICANGTNSFIFTNWTGDTEESITDLQVHNRAVIRALYAIELFLEKYPRRSTILGTSLGGIYSGFALGKFDLISKGAIVASGSNLAGILAFGRSAQLSEQRKKRYAHFQINSAQEYYQLLEREISIKIRDFQPGFHNKKLLHFRSYNDEVINVKYQDELINQFAPEDVSIYNIRFNHRRSIIWTYLRRKWRVVNFLLNP